MGSRRVLLPREVSGKLDVFAELKDEVNGILFYQRDGDSCPIEALYMTAVGTPGHVRADPNRMNVINEFFKINPQYQFVKFHTHSRGTMEMFGDYYATHWSSGDREGMKEQMSYDGEFMGMLITPETKLLCGVDNPKIIVSDRSCGYAEKNQKVHDVLSDIAKLNGIRLRRLQSKR